VIRPPLLAWGIGALPAPGTEGLVTLCPHNFLGQCPTCALWAAVAALRAQLRWEVAR
jgi:hypothetical protein